jgi:hypothetical protein
VTKCGHKRVEKKASTQYNSSRLLQKRLVRRWRGSKSPRFYITKIKFNFSFICAKRQLNLISTCYEFPLLNPRRKKVCFLNNISQNRTLFKHIPTCLAAAVGVGRQRMVTDVKPFIISVTVLTSNLRDSNGCSMRLKSCGWGRLEETLKNFQRTFMKCRA